MDTTPHPYDRITAEQLWAAGRLKWQEPGVVGAWIAEMDYGLAEPIAHTLRRAADDGWTGYPTSRDVHELRRACAAFQERAFGWRVDPEWVEPITDGLSALEAAIEQFSAPGSDVIVPVPAYMPFLTRPQLVGRRVVRVPMARDGERWAFDLDAIDAAFAAGAGLLVLCNPHNPIGQVHTAQDLAGVVDVVERRGGRVLSDEIHGPLTFPGHPHTPYATLGDAAAQHSITLVSAAKAWNIPGVKCAQAIVTAEADRRIWREQQVGSRHEPATLGILTNTTAYDDGGPWLAQTVAYLDRNRRLVAQLAGEQLPDLGRSRLEGTYLDWWDFTAYELGVPAHQWLLEQLRVLVTPGVECGSTSEATVRFNLGLPAPVLRDVIERMAAALAARLRLGAAGERTPVRP